MCSSMKLKLTAMMLALSVAAGAENISGSWKGVLDVQAMKLNLVFRIGTDSLGKKACFMNSPDQSASWVKTEVAYLSGDSINVKIPNLMAAYSGKLVGDTIRGTFVQMGRAFPLHLGQGELVYNRPQTPVEPFPYMTEEVAFENVPAGAVLRGTISYPVGYKKGDKVPVAIMVTGSGPQNRNSELFHHQTFLVIADYLARHGVATLRYDDRAVGESTGAGMTATTEEVADDARAGVEFLRGMACFSKVGVIGHSEGGIVAFMLGAAGVVDFAVSMAGTGICGLDVLYGQSKAITEAAGAPYVMTREQMRTTVENMHNPWMDYFMDYDPAEDIRKISCPVFVLNGDRDLQVIAKDNIPAIRENLPANTKSEIKVYPGLNHLFQECKTGMPTEYNSIEQTVSPQVLEDIATWIGAL